MACQTRQRNWASLSHRFCYGAASDNSSSAAPDGSADVAQSPDVAADGVAPEPDAGGVDSGNGAVTDGGLFKIDRSRLADASIDHPLDYGDPNLWVCKPGIDPNPCYGNKGELDSTEILPDGTTQVVKHVHAEAPKFDCFYVYPTVYLTGNGGNQTNLSNVDYVLDALMAQGARMSRLCEVYAPLYRQVNIAPNLVIPPDAGSTGDAGPTDAGAAASDASPGNGPLTGPGFMAAAADVNNAFKYYLDHFNHGRKFVLMGHSQGSGMLINVMQTQLETSDAVRAQLISALIIGGGVTVLPGQTTGEASRRSRHALARTRRAAWSATRPSIRTDPTPPRSSASPRTARTWPAPTRDLWPETWDRTRDRTFPFTSTTRSSVCRHRCRRWAPMRARPSCSTATRSWATAWRRTMPTTSRSSP